MSKVRNEAANVMFHTFVQGMYLTPLSHQTARSYHHFDNNEPFITSTNTQI